MNDSLLHWVGDLLQKLGLLAEIFVNTNGENVDLNNNPLQREFSSSNQKNIIFIFFKEPCPVLLQ
jgi:hypothetical protein